jgi:L-fucose isomerase-like protein
LGSEGRVARWCSALKITATVYHYHIWKGVRTTTGLQRIKLLKMVLLIAEGCKDKEEIIRKMKELTDPHL